VRISSESIAVYCREVFSLFLTVQATTDFGQCQKARVTESMQLLGAACGYSSVSELYSNEVSSMLDEFAASQSYLSWNRYSKDRRKFEAIVRNCKDGVARFLPIILTILHQGVDPKNEVEVRMDTLLLLEFLLSQQALHPALRAFDCEILSVRSLDSPPPEK